jgi:hypothetical protein
MQFTKAVVALAIAAGVQAHSNDTIVYTTIVVDSYTTVCPASSTITFNGVTYTNTLTESSTITVTNCPCTVSAPVYTKTSVTVPTTTPVYSNATTAVVSSTPVTVGTTSLTTKAATTAATATPSVVSASGGNKVFAMSGASLAGLLGLAAYIL